MRTRDLKALCDQQDPWPIFEQLLGQKLKNNHTIKSPFREEKNPSFGVYRGKDGKVRFKDFGGLYGDVYELVAYWHKVPYKKAVQVVAGMMGIVDHEIPPPRMNKLAMRRNVQVERPATCTFERREWSDLDRLFWEGRYNINIHLLNRYNVHACSFFSMTTGEGMAMSWNEGASMPLYVYAIGKHLKLYNPLTSNKKSRYIGNTDRNDIFGMAQCSERSELPTVICAGQKDALTMMANFRVRAISFNAEGLIPSAEVLLAIIRTSPRVLVLYDTDATGQLYSKKLTAECPVIERVPFETFSPVKDISDAVEKKCTDTLHTLFMILGAV